MVEFALVLPVVVLVLLAVVEVTVVARTQYELVHAAREGARTAATVADPSRAVLAVQAALDPAVARRVKVTVARPGTVGGSAVVTVVLPYRLGAVILGGLKVDMRARAVMRVER
ncbi:MAG: pilus assembly protein [Acidimicrobiia bacterium]|nr:pilus assembly protein [Acidimicrobiia bacterium]MDH3398514.1 pilus assembly protein [Acidimicrobiia bacterium]MDH5614932.1 pilus assembly protein [Acidimicrobiia bacterium]